MPHLTLHTATVRGRTAALWPPPARPAPATGGGTSHRLTSHRLTSPHLVDTCLYLYCIMMKLSCILYYLVITTSTTLWPHQATLLDWMASYPDSQDSHANVVLTELWVCTLVLGLVTMADCTDLIIVVVS